MTPTRLEITRPDDWHLHLRDGDALASVVGHTARRFARAIVMPNLKPPVTTVAQAEDYRRRILASLPAGARFQPLMTLYLTEDTPAEEIARAKSSDSVFAVKYYPAGATTNSQSGVRELSRVYRVIEAMEKHELPLLLHGEVTDPEIDIFDRERVFIERHLLPLRDRFPALRMVLEHITTGDAAEFVAAAPANVAATITAHHLLLNRNALFEGGIRPHHYCAPILKRETHRAALLQVATSGDTHFFLGTDSAPHPREAKEAACGCAGLYTAHAALELYAEAFEQAGRLDRLEAFASFHGPDFYRLPRNTDRIALVRTPWIVPDEYPLAGSSCVPMRAGGSVGWSLA
ncbi:dihydroorotase [Rhodanobacter thiooxydans]|uniref:Dihydroorotase n=1 Tax=Rhodanobacter thiooxydans TaxID=416169 RepID=A0A154QLK1_9GAMM|nr:dihydroorotase [Rhodanobacter thiooxydans]EIL97238.1 dihydroorotase [Rhodanobacter thiooxydans LCS2]KZC24636.1 dihydroorotase [Rhodanobacter thiooxydans]